MNGRSFIINIVVWLLLGVVSPMPAVAGGSAQPVAILLSDSEEAYSEPVAAFKAEIGVPVEVFNLEGDIDRAPPVMDDILSRDPGLIFALGAKAAFTAKTWTSDHQEVPVLFAMVINWQRYHLLEGQRNVFGVASDVAPGTQFANLTIMSPGITRIGAIYSKEHSALAMERARQAASILGLELVATPIEHPQDFRRAFREMHEKIDSFWLLADPVVFTLENIAWLEKRCIRDQLICLGQSKNVAKLGILLAVDPDNRHIGSQAATLAKSVLRGVKEPRDFGVMPPLGTNLFLNLNTAKKIGLELSQTALDMANTIIE